MAETELSVLGRQCLSRRIDSFDVLASESAAWSARRNAASATITWRFTVEDARIKLHRLYPSIEA